MLHLSCGTSISAYPVVPMLPTDTRFKQAKANGLLEVTALVSGDTTRRNRPGQAFRRAMARAMKRRQNERVSPTFGGKKGEDGGGSKHEKSKQEKNAEEDHMRHLPRHNRLSIGLSRVTEEDSMSKASNSAYHYDGLSGSDCDPDTGGSEDEHGNDNNIKYDKDPVHVPGFLSPWVGRLSSTRRIKGGGGSERSIASDGLESVTSNRPAPDRGHVRDATVANHLDDVNAPSSCELPNNTATRDSRRRDAGVKHPSNRKNAIAPTEILHKNISRDADSSDEGVTPRPLSWLERDAPRDRSGWMRSSRRGFAQNKADVTRGALARKIQLVSPLRDVRTSFHPTLEN